MRLPFFLLLFLCLTKSPSERSWSERFSIINILFICNNLLSLLRRTLPHGRKAGAEPTGGTTLLITKIEKQ